MASKTLQKIDKALSQVIVRPHTEVLAELKGIAAADRKNPAPRLAMAIVSGVYGMSRRDFDGARAHVQAAGKLLREMRSANDVESQFSAQLHKVLDTELYIVPKTQTPGRKLTFGMRTRIVNRSLDGQEAIAEMGKLARRIEGTSLPTIIYAAMRTLSQTTGPRSSNFRLGMAQLSRSFKGRDKLRDLAGFFMNYGYRRKRNYRGAQKVCQKLEKRNPRSPLPKKMRATAYYYGGDMKAAEKMYEKAIALAPPKDPRGLICYARILDRLGEVEQAQEVLAKAQSLDRQGAISSIIEKETGRLELQRLIVARQG